MPAKLSPVRLQEAFVKDLSDVWRFFQREFHDQTPYAFVMYGNEGAVRFHAQILTEQGLETVAAKYVGDQIYETLDEARKALRFSIADSPLFARFIDNLPNVDALLESDAEELQDPEGFEILAKAAIAAFKKLDKVHLFGEGNARENLLLLICTEDTEFEISDKSAKSLNSKAAAKQFIEWNKVDGPWSQCELLAVSADGTSILAAVVRENPNQKENQTSSIHELISYIVTGNKLSRCVIYTESSLGPGYCEDLAPLPNSNGFIVLRGYWTQEPHTVLIHVNPTSEPLVKKQELLGQPARLAISQDGSQIAVSMMNKGVSVFDPNLNLKYEFQFLLPIEPECVLFLPTGELLVGCSEQILLYDPTTGKQTEATKLPGHRMAVDPAGKILATSQWFTFGEDSDEPFGVTLLNLPTFQQLHKVQIPGRQIVSPSISSDGKLLAVVAKNPAKYDSSRVFIYDLISGEPLTDFACHHNWPVHFFPDCQRVAFGGSHFGKTPPIWVCAFRNVVIPMSYTIKSVRATNLRR